MLGTAWIRAYQWSEFIRAFFSCNVTCTPPRSLETQTEYMCIWFGVSQQKNIQHSRDTRKLLVNKCMSFAEMNSQKWKKVIFCTLSHWVVDASRSRYCPECQCWLCNFFCRCFPAQYDMDHAFVMLNSRRVNENGTWSFAFLQMNFISSSSSKYQIQPAWHKSYHLSKSLTNGQQRLDHWSSTRLSSLAIAIWDWIIFKYRLLKLFNISSIANLCVIDVYDSIFFLSLDHSVNEIVAALNLVDFKWAWCEVRWGGCWPARFELKIRVPLFCLVANQF